MLQTAGNAVATDDDGPAEWLVGNPFPNPTAGGAQLSVRLAAAGAVTVCVFDVLGRQVQRTERTGLTAGTAYTVEVPTEGLAPGVYAVRLSGGGSVATRSLTVVR